MDYGSGVMPEVGLLHFQIKADFHAELILVVRSLRYPREPPLKSAVQDHYTHVEEFVKNIKQVERVA